MFAYNILCSTVTVLMVYVERKFIAELFNLTLKITVKILFFTEFVPLWQ